MNRPLKVLQVVHSLGMGGAETWLMELLKHWSRQDVQVDFLLTSGQGDIFDEQAKRLGAKLHYIQYGRQRLPAFITAYRALLKRERYDAIHHHADYAAGWQFLAALGVLPKVRVAHVHNPWLHITSNYAVSPTRRLATRGGRGLLTALATHVCGTSAEILRQYGFDPSNAGRPKSLVVHCGFDVDRFQAPREPDRTDVLAEFGWSADSKVILFAGRLDRALAFSHPQNHKNSWLALHVAKRARELDPSIKLIMAGAGDARSDLEQHVRGWGAADDLRLVGVREDIARLMRSAEVLLFPSAQEGLGMVAVEAQAAGLPVLASDAVPDEAVVVPELYTSVSLDASVEDWAKALIARIDAPKPNPDDVRERLKRSAFSIDESARRLRAVYSGAV